MSEEIWTIKKILDWTKEYFQKQGIPGARFDAEILLAHTLQIPRIKLYTDFERPLSKDELTLLKEYIKRRIAKEPIAYILGQKDFYTDTFLVNSKVLIPRPETELIIDEIRKNFIPSDTFSFLDIGTGSGCIAITIKKLFPSAIVTATDISEEALNVAKENAVRILGKEDSICFIHSDVFDSVTGVFDVIVSNPPYIPLTSKESLDADVRDHEPSLALFAGEMGMDVYEKILSGISNHLAASGKLFLEIGIEVTEPLKKRLLADGYQFSVSKDLQGIDRVLIISGKK